MMANCVVFLCFYLANLFLLQHSSSASSIITPSKPVLQGQTLVSQDQAFELGFFDPNNSGNHYVGIWYKTISPRVVVWVANGGNPVVNSSSSLQIGNKDGNLRLVDGEQEVIWSTNISAPSNSSFAELSNGGNLILRDNISDQILWQSALNPSNTAFPGTWKVSDSKSGRGIVLISWKSENDPSPGSFTVGITLQSPPQSFTWKDSKPYWRSGQWDRSKFIGIKDADETYLSYYTILDDTEQGTASLTLRTVSGCTFANLFISSTGDLKYMCYEVGKGWYSKWQLPQSRCDVYGVCGPFAICIRSEPITCRCFKGFTPKTPDQWNKRNWTEGCVRQTQLSCETKATNQTSKAVDDGFSRIRGLKLPDFSEYVEVSDAGCKQWCLMNCTCLAYAFVNGIGCLVWATQILDVANLSPQGEDLFLRLAHSELDEEKKAVKWIISIIALSCFVVFCVVAYCFLKGKAKQRLNQKASILTHHTRRSNLEGDDPMDVPLFDFGDILDATNNFNATNKLGQGGFGPVYKGILKDGKDVAVKRLSSSSEQGVDEFKNEIMLISKLQHRNLVRLIGYCVEREEKILIYEFMPHKSLDTYLFDSTKKTVLDWPKRFNIILGIARGMSYLHRDSYLRVIHRDLKASNILLDEKMNPKISDFGLARIFEGTQVLANTHRVVGTLGYMSPEYAMSGIFSEKSDVFSFGVLLLEIVGGKKINSFQYDEEYSGILAYAWHSWGESKGLGMVDEALGGSFDSSEAAKCVNIGLLCVQDYAGDRPTMPDIVFMLSGETNNIPHPKQPALSFYTTLSSHIHSHSHFASSENELTESIIQEGR